MRVLITGATGFLGRHIAAALRANGHAVVCAVRRPPHPTNAAAEGNAATPEREALPCDAFVEADFTRDTTPDAWVPRLKGIDVVINAVGILREHGSQTFALLHAEAPCALFDACVTAGVRRVIQISALGADDQATSGYHLSKRRADRHLQDLPLDWTIVQPSLVYGPGGTSARLFTLMASLPVVPLPGRGDQRVQPIHIDDLTDAIVALVSPGSRASREVVPFVGPTSLTFRDFLVRLRAAMDLGRARCIPMPMFLMHAAAAVGSFLPGALLDRETLRMLLRGNVADPGPIRAVLEREPRPVERFIERNAREPTRTTAQLAWLLPMLRVSIALVWIVTGIVSLGLYPVEQSYELLARTGVPASLQPLFLYGAAGLDLAFGIATLAMKRRRALWIAQAALILGYTLIITFRLPEFWLHPYGPLLKNLPMLAAIALLYCLEDRR